MFWAVPASPVSWGSWWNWGQAPASLTTDPFEPAIS
jgi:hypothetical protein